MHNFSRLRDREICQNFVVAFADLTQSNPQAAYSLYQKYQNFFYELTSTGLRDRVVVELENTLGESRSMLFECKVRMLNNDFRPHRRNQELLNDWVHYMENNATDWDEINEFLTDHGLETCPDCGEYAWENNMRHTYHDEHVCDHCIDSNYHFIDRYDAYVYREYVRNAIDEDGEEIEIYEDDSDFHWDDDLDTYVHDCYDGSSRRRDSSMFLRSYHSSKNSFRPVDSPWSAEFGRFYGLELEVECSQDIGEKVDLLNQQLNDGTLGTRCFFENDGSLAHGFEIITQPMGFDRHEAFWQWVNEKSLIAGLTSHQTNSCGLHIHVTRSALGTLQLNKMIAFVNHPDNRPIIEGISRRYGMNYARIDNNKTIQTPRGNGNSRYDAINLETYNEQTVEFRIFRGTLKYSTIMACLEFVNALIEFTKPESGYGFDLSTDNFLSFIEKPHMQPYTHNLRTTIAVRMELA